MSKVLHLRNLSRREREAVMHLRGEGDARCDIRMTTAFAALLPVARAGGYIILPADAPFVHADEQRLLACLTLLQRRGARQWTACDIELDDDLTLALQACAALLDQAGIHLCHRNAIRVLERAGIDAQGWGLTRRDTLLPDARESIPSDRPERSLQARIMRFVAEQGAVATHDLIALGASSRLVGAMRRKGMLHRVRHGLYTLGRIDRQITASSGPARHFALA